MAKQPGAIIFSSFLFLIGIFFAVYTPLFTAFMLKPATRNAAFYGMLVPSAITIDCFYYAIDLIKFPGNIFKSRPLHSKLLSIIIMVFIIWLIAANMYLKIFR